MDSWLDGVGVVLVNHALALPQANHSRPNYAKIVTLYSLSDNCLIIYFMSLVLLLWRNAGLLVKLGIFYEFISIKIMIRLKEGCHLYSKYSTVQVLTVQYSTLLYCTGQLGPPMMVTRVPRTHWDTSSLVTFHELRSTWASHE